MPVDFHTSSTNGIIAGVIQSQALVCSLSKIAGRLCPGLCGPAFENFAQTILGASDIMQDGKHDPSKVSDGISIGLGFEMKPVALGAVLAKNPPSADDPCDGTD
jgi:hypothetical protein